MTQLALASSRRRRPGLVLVMALAATVAPLVLAPANAVAPQVLAAAIA